MSKGTRTRRARETPRPRTRGKSQARRMLERELAATAPATVDEPTSPPTCEPGEGRCARLALYRVGRAYACDRHVEQLRAARYKRDMEVAIWKANPGLYAPELLELAGKAPLIDVLERQLAGYL